MTTLTMELIEEAQRVLQPIISRTPLVRADKIQEHLWIKAESLQLTGAFKLRGAYYRLSKLSEEQKKRGVIAASAGNHAQGVAYACKEMGIKGTIVMPKTAPLSKIEATRSYGVKVELQGDMFNDAYEYAKNLQTLTDAVFIEPFNDPYIMAGQGTIALEIYERMPDVDVVLVPVGGGGLVSGIAYAMKHIKPDCKVYGVEAGSAASMQASLAAGQIVKLENAATIADGIAVKAPGDQTLAVCKTYLDGIITVSEDEIAAGILTLLEKMKMVAEGAGAVSVAAAMFEKLDLHGKNCVAVLSGGNIDVNFLSKIIDLGLMKTGRKVILDVPLVDKPGNLSKLLHLISTSGANVVSVDHNRYSDDMLSGICTVRCMIETTSEAHIGQLLDTLFAHGFHAKIQAR